MNSARMYEQEMMAILKRITIIRRVIDKNISLDTDNQNTEVCFLNFRKILEHIAFSSLITNEEKYSKIQKNYKKFYRAKDILQEISKLNKNFYPKPVDLKADEEIKHINFIDYCELNKTAPLTVEEFNELYDIASDIIHIQNPFSRKDFIDMKLDIDSWLRKITALLNRHTVQFVDDERWWLVEMLGENSKPKVHTLEPKTDE